MPIEFRCTQCQRLLRTADGTEGKRAKCPECGAVLEIPAAAARPTGGPFGGVDGGTSPFGPGSSAAGPETPFAQVGPPPAAPSGPENPYQSPRAPTGPQIMGSADVRAYAASRVAAPGIALIITGAIDLAMGVFSAIANLLSVAFQNFGEVPGFAPEPQFAPEPGFAMFTGGLAVVSAIAGIVLAILVIVGGVKMKNLESYGLAMTGAVIAVMPCFHACCVVTLPFGIWALVVLSDNYVRAAFQSSMTP